MLDPGDPLPSAEEFLARRYRLEGRRTLHHQNSEFHAWADNHYPTVANDEIRAGVYSFLAGALKLSGKVEVPFKPNTSRVRSR